MQPSVILNLPAMSQPLQKLPQALSSPQPVSMPQPKARALPTVTIVEEPAAKELRFRYKCECRSVGAIPGVNSLRGNKTYPTIRINNYTGWVTIVVSCVTKEHPYKPHPHYLVGRVGQDGFKNGVFSIRAEVKRDANEYQFRNLGVQCVKRTEIKTSLKKRAKMNIDPFNTGFKHAEEWKTMKLKAVRLAFHVFLHDLQGGDKLTPLKPVVSNVVYDKKTPDLHISAVIGCSGPVNARAQIGLLCEKVKREDTVVVVYEEDEQGNVIWEVCAHTMLVHKQVAIVFETPTYNPPYYDPRTHRGSITLNIQLKSIVNNDRSNSVSFEYIPDRQGAHKKLKTFMSELKTSNIEPTADQIPKSKIQNKPAPSTTKAQEQKERRAASLDPTPIPRLDLLHKPERAQGWDSHHRDEGDELISQQNSSLPTHSPHPTGVRQRPSVHELLLNSHSPRLESFGEAPPAHKSQINTRHLRFDEIHVPSPYGSPMDIYSSHQGEIAETSPTDGSLSAENLFLRATGEDTYARRPPDKAFAYLNGMSGTSVHATIPTTNFVDVSGIDKTVLAHKSPLSDRTSTSEIQEPRYTYTPHLGEISETPSPNGSTLNGYSPRPCQIELPSPRTSLNAHSPRLCEVSGVMHTCRPSLTSPYPHVEENHGLRGWHTLSQAASQLCSDLQLQYNLTTSSVTHLPQHSQQTQQQQANEIIDESKLGIDSDEIVQMMDVDTNSTLRDLSNLISQDDFESLSGSLKRLTTNS